jgi:hypothetical protein
VSFKSFLIGAVILAAGSSVTAQASNLLTNGSFETGDFTDWVFTGDTVNNFTTVVLSSGNAYKGQVPPDGAYYVGVGDLVATNASLSQTFSDTPGELLTISGYISGDGFGPSVVTFNFNGNTIFALGSPTGSVPDQPYTKYTVTATATGSDTFSVGFGDGPSQLALDNFSVSPVSGVPEPGTWALLLIGFAGLSLLRYRKRNAGEIAAV